MSLCSVYMISYACYPMSAWLQWACLVIFSSGSLSSNKLLICLWWQDLRHLYSIAYGLLFLLLLGPSSAGDFISLVGFWLRLNIILTLKWNHVLSLATVFSKKIFGQHCYDLMFLAYSNIYIYNIWTRDLWNSCAIRILYSVSVVLLVLPYECNIFCFISEVPLKFESKFLISMGIFFFIQNFIISVY